MSTPNIWRPFSQMQTTSALKVVKAQDALLTLEDGQEIIDAISSWWVITHGHCQQEVSDAIGKQAGQLDQTLFANFIHNPAQELIEELSSVLPKDLHHYFFTDNGSTAVESALKMVIQRWHHLEEQQRSLFLSFQNSYHGDTIGAMSVGGDSIFTTKYKKYLFDVLRLEQGQYSYDTSEQYCRHFLEAMEKHADKIAGVIIEPLIQGAGGMITWPKEALEAIGKQCKEKNIPIIFDEVMTGFGRTGTLFALDQLNFNPDILCLSKGLTAGSLPLALTVANEEIYKDFLSHEKEKMFFHGHSFTGNPISCAAAIASLRIFKERNFTSVWEQINSIHRERSQEIHSPIIKDIRVLGTMAAVELKAKEMGYTSQLSEHMRQFALKRGVFLRPLGNVIYILPPYSISSQQLHHVWDVIDSFIKLSGT